MDIWLVSLSVSAVVTSAEVNTGGDCVLPSDSSVWWIHAQEWDCGIIIWKRLVFFEAPPDCLDGHQPVNKEAKSKAQAERLNNSVTLGSGGFPSCPFY